MFSASAKAEWAEIVAARTEEHPVESVIITGGVACNAGLRRAAVESRIGVPIYFPTPGLSTDNAAMIVEGGGVPDFQPTAVPA